MIHDDDAHYATACFLLSNISSSSSYRSELEGIFRSLKHVEYLSMAPAEIAHWCDNEAAVNKCMTPLWKPSAMIQPDADILLAIHHLRNTFRTTGTTVVCRHVYGHQDTRTPRISVPDSPTPSDMPSGSDSDTTYPLHVSRTPPPPVRKHDTPTMINIACDKLATETSAAALAGARNTDLPPTLPYPLPGSRAQLRIGDTWITSHQRRHILWERRAHILRTYCMEKYHWSENTFDSIHWPIIRSVRARASQTIRMATSKILHGWLPVMHMLSHMTSSAQCPGCSNIDETLDHLFHCPHPLLVSTRMEIISTLRKTGLKRRVPRPFLDCIINILSSHFGMTTMVPPHPAFAKALDAQSHIGFDMFLRGYIALDWSTALGDMDTDLPARIMVWTLRFLWFDCVDPLWRARNRILHDQENAHTTSLDSHHNTTLQWYLDNEDAIAPRDRYLLNFSADTVPHLPARTKKELVRLLDTARAIHTQECALRDRGQSSITDYFTCTTRSRA